MAGGSALGTLVVMAWRNLLRGWRRSGVVLVAISVGLSACLVLVAWTPGQRDALPRNVFRSENDGRRIRIFILKLNTGSAGS